MRGKKAKKFRRMAETYVINVEKKPLGTGYRQYKYVENRIDWVPQLDDDGFPLNDPETNEPLMKPAPVPGTIYNEYLVRVIYKKLKRDHYARLRACR